MQAAVRAVTPAMWAATTAVALMWAAGVARAQTTVVEIPPGSVFTCVDKRGLHITSDRPIPECRDREQRVLSPSGVERLRIGPVLSVSEQAQLRERNRLALEDQQRVQEQRRRDRVLLIRYPNQAVHAQESRKHLAQFDDLLRVARQRLEEMQQQYAGLTRDMQPWAADTSQAPQHLREVWEQASSAIAEQERLIATTEAARQQQRLRLDEELHRLQHLWQQQKEEKAQGQ